MNFLKRHKKKILLIVIGLIVILGLVNYYSTDLIGFMCSPRCSKNYGTIALQGNYSLNDLSMRAKQKGYSADFGMGVMGIISNFGNDAGENKDVYKSIIIQINKNLYQIVEKDGKLSQPSLTPMYLQINKPGGGKNYWSFQIDINGRPTQPHYKIRQQLKQTFENLGIETGAISKVNFFNVHYKLD